MNFGQKLKNLREAKSLSTTELARMVKLSQGYISALEIGTKTSPTKNTIDKLAQALSIPSSYFLEEDFRTPFDMLPNMPQDVKEFLLKQENTPYMELSQKAKKQGITPKMLEELLDSLISIMESRNKS